VQSVERNTDRAAKRGHRLQRFEEVLDLLPKSHVFDGELVALDDAGRPLFVR
jgi:hypothetical protein